MATQKLNDDNLIPYDHDEHDDPGEPSVDEIVSQLEESASNGPSVELSLIVNHVSEGDHNIDDLRRFSQYLSKESSSRYNAIVLNTWTGDFDDQRYTVGLVDAKNGDHRNGVVRALKITPFHVRFKKLEESLFDSLHEQLYNPQAQNLAKAHQQTKQSQMTKKWGEGKTLLTEEEESAINSTIAADLVDETEEWIDLTDTDEYQLHIKRNEAELTTQQFIRLILMEFLRSGSSDMHLEAGQPNGRIRFRYDSEMFTRWDNIPFVKMKQLAMGMAETARKDATQMKFKDIDSTIKVRALRDGQIADVELRFASQPTLYAPSIVLRSQLKPIRDIGAVGFLPQQIADLQAAYSQKRGILVVTGATGSGKTNTLEAIYAALEEPDNRKIIEIGEPIEIRSPWRTQISLRPNTPFSWWDAFYSCLRADPDIIGIGELRSPEHASVAINAALTGHLVLSTFHAASVEDTLSRMFQMGLPRENLATGLNMVLAQALVKKLCERCKTRDKRTSDEYDCVVFKGVGCPDCFNKGTRGRTAMAELLYFNDEVKEWIQNRNLSARDIVHKAKEAGFMIPMRTVAHEKVRSGITSEMEVAGVLGLVESKRQYANKLFADSQVESPAGRDDSIDDLIENAMVG